MSGLLLGMPWLERRRTVLEGTFTSVYGTADSLVAGVTSAEFLLCCVSSLVLGLVAAGVYMIRHDHSKSFVVTLALLPLIVQAVITLVNGNLGAGIAVMGVFNLVRFRSIPGSAKDIGSVFFAMAIGLATGMGFLTLAVLFTAIVCLANIAYAFSPFGKQVEPTKTLTVSIPEDLAFDGLFDEVLSRYAATYELMEIRTTNMGSLYQLQYRLRLRRKGEEKPMMDELRCLNGNLKVALSMTPASLGTL